LGIIRAAAPIFAYGGALEGSLGISGPSVRLTPEKLPEYNELVMAAA
jgi:DNA-binding IclR family transcriptional regulator